jgi:hypothetical protein
VYRIPREEEGEIPRQCQIHRSHARGEWYGVTERRIEIVVSASPCLRVERSADVPQSRGPWVGIETEDLDRFGVVTLPSGSKEGVHYFHLTPPQSDTHAHTLADADIRAARQRQLERIREGLGNKSKLVGLGLGLGGARVRLWVIGRPSRRLEPFS